MEIKKYLKAIWHFIWVEDTWLSWIVNVLLAFIIIKFLVYPGLGLVLGTGYPIVAVVSSSMEHPVGFDEWWDSPSCNDQTSQGQLLEVFGIDKTEFLDFPFTGGFNKGDIMILYIPKILKIGDILTFNANTRNDPIIHRIVGVKEQNSKMYYQTKGDNNCGSADFENAVTSEQAIGKAVWRIPFLGWIKIGFVNLIKLVGIM